MGIGSGKRLQDAVRLPIDNTLGHLSQHLATMAAASTVSVPVQPPTSDGILSQKHPPAQEVYNRTSPYATYLRPGERPRSESRTNSTPSNYVSPNPSISMNTTSAYQNQPQYSYQTPYASDSSSYAPSYTPTAALPATAAAANAYLNSYPAPSQPHQNFQPTTNNPEYSSYHSPGSPTSWRHWAGNMASNLEPGQDYISSASALMQLGGRGEEPGAHDLRANVDLQQQGVPVENGTDQIWPLMILDGGNPRGDG